MHGRGLYETDASADPGTEEIRHVSRFSSQLNYSLEAHGPPRNVVTSRGKHGTVQLNYASASSSEHIERHTYIRLPFLLSHGFDIQGAVIF